MDLKQHIIRELGVPEQSYVVDGPNGSFRIHQVAGVPESSAVAYVTDGVNDVVLEQPSGRRVRQEFVLVVRRSCVADDVRRPIGTVADGVIGSGCAVVRGEVINGPGPILPGSGLVAVCGLAPAILPQDFWLSSATDPATMFVWLVPLTADEADLASEVGPDVFEGHLVDAQAEVDLLDMRRDPFYTAR